MAACFNVLEIAAVTGYDNRCLSVQVLKALSRILE